LRAGRRGGSSQVVESRAATAAPPTRRERRRLDRLERARTATRPRSISRNPIWRSPVAIISGVAVLAGLALIIALGQNQAPAPEPSSLNIPPTSYASELVAGDALGHADAPVTLEIWSDFQCPFCGQLARTYLPRLVSEFVIDGQLRLVPRDVDFVGRGDPNESVEAAVAASCAADQGMYWQYHDTLLWNQIGENQGAFSEARLRQMADQVGLDRASWDQCRTDPAREAAVAATTSEALAAGINGTPTLVLNGVATSGMPRSYEDLADAVQSALAAVPARP
jgi:protein-disulfide isomerase